MSHRFEYQSKVKKVGNNNEREIYCIVISYICASYFSFTIICYFVIVKSVLINNELSVI
jgi:hypothetical protein